jgi:hypothetical protein
MNECKQIAMPGREQLLDYINQVSLAVYDTLLFLDTHPFDPDAMTYFEENNKLRRAAVREYERLFGPLTIDNITTSSNDTWEWVMQPWPWERGNY